jgi:hypothetical protein
MAKENEIPGVRLEHRGSKVFEVAGVKKAEMTVIATIKDESIWKDVEKKFIDGFDVFTIEDFKGEMLQALRMENEELEARLRILEVEAEKKDRQIELLEGKLDDAQRPLAELGRRLRGQ